MGFFGDISIKIQFEISKTSDFPYWPVLVSQITTHFQNVKISSPRPSLSPSVFIFFTRTTGLISTKLGT